jgi:hypothetical protein
LHALLRLQIASWLFGDEITPINVVGLCITMIGAFCVGCLQALARSTAYA